MFKKIVIALGMIAFAACSRDWNVVSSNAIAHGDANALLGTANVRNNAQSNANLQQSSIRNALLAANIQAANQRNNIY